MAKYTVRKIKKFLGHEGHGFNAELLRDGEPVAFVIDEGNGGCAKFDWYCREWAPSVVRTDVGTEKQIMLLKGQAELREHIRGQTRTFDGITLDLNEDIFVAELIEAHERTALLKRACRAATCYRLKDQKDGEYMRMALVFTDDIANKLRKQYGERLECIYNEELKKEA